MKLLFDQNLSPRLVDRLADLFPGSSHVSLLGLARVPDGELWAFARDNGFIIVTKDADFGDLGVVLGFPPRVIWLRLGNCTTGEIERVLRASKGSIDEFASDDSVGILTLM